MYLILKRTLTLIKPIVLCSLVLFFWQVGHSCKKSAYPTQYVDEESKNYCDFKAGSFWVYKELSNGWIDTIEIEEHSSNIVENPDISRYPFEQIAMYANWHGHSPDATHQVYLILEAHYGTVDIDDSYILEVNPYSSAQSLVYSSFHVNDKYDAHYVGDTLFNTDFLDTLTVQGTLYHSVKQMHSTNSSHLKRMVNIYWCLGIGRIKFDFLNGEQWELIDYHIIK